MTAVNRTTLYSYFDTGDRPTSPQFGDLIDSSLNLIAVSGQTISSDVSALGKLDVMGSLTVGSSATFNDVLVNGSLNVGGSFSLNDITVNNLTAGGLASLTTLRISSTTSAASVNATGTLKVDGAATLGGGIIGVTASSNASTGNVGQIIESTVLVSAAVSLTDNTNADVTFIALTGGDWDVWGNILSNVSAPTVMTVLQGAISVSSATIPAAPNGGGYANWQGSGVAGNNEALSVGMKRMTVDSSANAYLVAYSRFTTSINGAYGYIGARRRR